MIIPLSLNAIKTENRYISDIIPVQDTSYDRLVRQHRCTENINSQHAHTSSFFFSFISSRIAVQSV